MREVSERKLTPSAGEAPLTWTIERDAGDSARTIHSKATLHDASGAAAKIWSFEATPGEADFGLPVELRSRKLPAGVDLSVSASTWSVHPVSGQRYVSAVTKTMDPNTANEKTSKTTTSIDEYGNVLQAQVYDYGDLVNPARTYTNSYWHSFGGGQPYKDNYLVNLQFDAKVSGGGTAWTLFENYYDNYGHQGWLECPGGAYSTLVYRHGLAQHDGAFDSDFDYRGNVAMSVSGGVTRCLQYDITGMLAWSGGDAPEKTYNPTKNNTVPSRVQTESLPTDFEWNSFLGLTEVEGSNGETSTFSYDNYARVDETTSPEGR